MSHIEPEKDSISLSVEKVIDLVRLVRNDLVKDFLKGELLDTYYKEACGKELTNVKREFVKRELRELLVSPVDLVHYAGLINQIGETNTASIAEKNSDYFYSDIRRIISKYEF